MDPEEIQVAIQQIYSSHPWASEETVEQLAKYSRSSTIKSAALATAIAQMHGFTSQEKLKKHLKDVSNQIKRDVGAGERRIKSMDDHLRKIGSASVRGSTGLESMTELAGAGAEAMHAATKGIGNLGGKVGAVGNVASWATGGTVAITAIGAMFSKLITTQEKELRAMIDTGLLLGNMEDYTELRGQAAQTGMSLSDYTVVMQNASGAITGLTGNMSAGHGVFYDFLTDKDRIKHVQHFGYTPKELAGLLVEETEQLYMLNQVNELNGPGQSKVIDSFKTSQKMSMYLADTLGVQRSSMMEARNQARENIEFQFAMNKNSDYLNETFGEGTAKRVTEANDFIAMFGSAIFGEDISNSILDIFVGTSADIQLDTSAVNNIQNEAFKEQIMMIPGLFPVLMEYLEDSATGQVMEESDHIQRMQELVRIIKSAGMINSYQDNALAVNKLVSQMITLPEVFLEGTEQEIKNKLDSIQRDIDGADDPIEMVGGMAQTFLKVQHQITPGFETMGVVMGTLEQSVGRFADFWRDLFGLDHASNSAMEVELNAYQQSAIEELTPRNRGFSVGGDRPIDVTTGIAYDSASAEAVANENSASNVAEAKYLKDFILESSRTIKDLVNRIEDTEVKEIEEQLNKLNRKLKKAENKGDTDKVSELKLEKAQLNLAWMQALAVSGPLKTELKDLREQVKLASERRNNFLRSYDSAQIQRRSDTDKFAKGSTIQGIMLAELMAQGITDKQAQANILGMIHGESAFKLTEEQSYENTSVERIKAAMGRRVENLTDPQLEKLKKDPEAFFDYVYKAEGGYEYRGRGLIQLTGKDNYKKVGDLIGEDLVNNPDLMLNPEIAARASAAYFSLPRHQKNKTKLTDMSVVYEVVYGANASSASRQRDLATRDSYANQFLSAMNSGELTYAVKIPSELQPVTDNTESTATMSLDELRAWRLEVIQEGPLIPDDADEINDWESQIELLERAIAQEVKKVEDLMKEQSNG